MGKWEYLYTNCILAKAWLTPSMSSSVGFRWLVSISKQICNKTKLNCCCCWSSSMDNLYDIWHSWPKLENPVDEIVHMYRVPHQHLQHHIPVIPGLHWVKLPDSLHVTVPVLLAWITWGQMVQYILHPTILQSNHGGYINAAYVLMPLYYYSHNLSTWEDLEGCLDCWTWLNHLQYKLSMWDTA